MPNLVARKIWSNVVSATDYARAVVAEIEASYVFSLPCPSKPLPNQLLAVHVAVRRVPVSTTELVEPVEDLEALLVWQSFSIVGYVDQQGLTSVREFIP